MSESAFPWARLPPLAHTHTCTHTRAETQAHLHKRPAHRTGPQRPGPGGGPQALALGVQRKDPQASPRRAPGREGPRPQRALPVHLQSRERAEGRGRSWDPGASGRESEKPVPAETRAGRTDRGWPPPSGAGRGWGRWGPRADAPSLPCPEQHSPVRLALPRSPGGGRWKLAFV